MPTQHALFTRTQLQVIDGQLALLEAQRAQQLLGITAHDAVSTAYRRTVADMVDELRVARRRIAEGSYGECRHCSRRIDRDRLQWRPWATRCTDCATLR